MNLDLERCGVCSKDNARAIADDGGSHYCGSCGLWHRCADGIARAGPGPLSCFFCKKPKSAALAPMNLSLDRCGVCGKDNPPIYANDGGSHHCSTCGLWHRCANGTIARGSPGPALCPLCRGGQQPAEVTLHHSTALRRESLPKPAAYCDGCQAKIFEAPGERFKCRQCADFDFCKRCIVSQQHNNMHSFADVYASRSPSAEDFVSRDR